MGGSMSPTIRDDLGYPSPKRLSSMLSIILHCALDNIVDYDGVSMIRKSGRTVTVSVETYHLSPCFPMLPCLYLSIRIEPFHQEFYIYVYRFENEKSFITKDFESGLGATDLQPVAARDWETRSTYLENL